MSNSNNKLAKVKSCPTCGEQATIDAHPFCSKRCGDIDLGRWFQGLYAIPAFDSADDSIVDVELVASKKLSSSDLD